MSKGKVPLSKGKVRLSSWVFLLDENLSWKNHIHAIENKISKSIGILFKAKFILNQKCLKSIYFSFIHCYLNYANILWASTNQSKLRKIHKQQKHASRIIYNKEITTSSRPLLKSLNTLNIYQLNIFQTILCYLHISVQTIIIIIIIHLFNVGPDFTINIIAPCKI